MTDRFQVFDNGLFHVGSLLTFFCHDQFRRQKVSGGARAGHTGTELRKDAICVTSEVKANFIQIPADIDMIQHTKAITTYTPDYNRPIDLFTRRFPHPASPINPSTASFLPPNLPLAAEVGLLDCPVLLQVNYQGEVEA